MSTLNRIGFGKNIKKRRKALGLTQFKLAEQIGISPNHLSSIETGKSEASVNIIIKLCDALDVTPDYLFLGNMHLNNISIDLIEIIRRVSDEDLVLLLYIAKYLADRNTNT